MVTKKEFRGAMKKIDGRFQSIDITFLSIDKKFDSIDKHFRIINERFISIEDTIEEIRANMYTKQDHARDLVWMDKAMAEIEAAREERILSGRQMLHIDDKVFDHEKRIRVLENKKLCRN